MTELLQILERTISQSSYIFPLLHPYNLSITLDPADQQQALDFLRQACETHYVCNTFIFLIDNTIFIIAGVRTRISHSSFERKQCPVCSPSCWPAVEEHACR